MGDIKIVRDKQENQFIINNDIEEVLSGGSNGNKLKIKKIDSYNQGGHRLQDKIELSSNKDVDIGLDLLVNKDKINKKEAPNTALNLNDGSYNRNQQEQYQSSDNVDHNVIDLNKSPEIDFNMMMNSGPAIDPELQLDKTSRLSQSEIDAFIDKNDASVKPQLISELEIHNLNNMDRVSHHSRHSHHSRRSDKSRAPAPEVDKYDDRRSSKSETRPESINEYQNYNYDPDKERKEKEEILWQLEKYRRLGIQGVRKYNMSSDVQEMRSELIKIKKARELDGSVKFQRKCMVAFATGTELLNNKLDILDFKLDGWSEQVNENINEYDEVFEELHEKYKERAKMAPELKLMFMMGGSAFMFHITNSMFKNSVPGMEDIMRQNPELMKQFADAAINQMDGEKKSAATFFNSFAPGNDPAGNRPMPTAPEYNRNPDRMRPPQPSNSTQQFNEVEEITSERSAFNNSSNKIPEPVGVDDILNELQSNTGNISDITSRSSYRSNRNRSQVPKRSINLNLN